ncbi:MAG: tRNA (adenosine(37)-N6)-threonylcarbamoyltransferase complex dimerization subunit type 1 TsaB [Peptoniphilaceae bacterium]|nr:tRNA (adenosine(37)-N6)-threonylcarbamoyltransferase complex dimerization subunit type 1 TsaB [Peptoniphilaceae bacterium]MDY6019346.1 tRNA (adenosine(37)-N6)-threonylcarbamoyltransferase complex dimerization subunit type 1 TsaB [Anaerococcus sp.]
MKVLAIDTSTMISTVTISEDDKIIGDFNVNQEKTHSESLVPMIETLLKLLGLELSDIDLFAIANGPGSFTGLRISMAVVKTLAQVKKKSIIPISTLEALANNSSSQNYKVSMLDARGNRVYAALYSPDLKEEIIKEDLYTIDVFSKMVNEMGFEVDLVGEICKKYAHMFEKGRILPLNFNTCIGKSLIKLALSKKDCKYDLFSLVPNYLRKSQAERDLEKK